MKLRKLVKFLFTSLLLVGMSFGLIFSNVAPMSATIVRADNSTSGNDDQNDDYSFYHLASSAATYFEGSQNPNNKGVKYMEGKDATKETETGATGGLSIGNAGGLVGYADAKYDTHNWIGALTAATAKGSQNHSYSTFQSARLRPIYEYGLYGHALTAMGLDSTDSQMSIYTIFRRCGGALMILAYATAISVPMIFKGMLHLMQTLNPFQWFIGAVAPVSGGHYEAVTDRSGQLTRGSGLGSDFVQGMASIRKTMGGLYSTTQYYGLYILLPASILMMIALWLVFNKVNIGSAIKKWFIRLFIIVAAVPLLADTYTETINTLLKNVDTFNPAANEIIAGTFDDFEGWASNTRLAMPKGEYITLDLSNSPEGQISNYTGSKSFRSSSNVRDLSRQINILAGNNLISTQDGASDYNSNSLWGNSSNMYNSNRSNSSKTSTQAMGAGFSILGRFTTDAKYAAADYETEYKSHPLGLSRHGDQISEDSRKKVLAGIKYFATNPETFYNDGSSYFIAYGNEHPEPKDKNTEADFLYNSSYDGIKARSTGGTNAKPKYIQFYGNGKPNNQNDSTGSNVYGLSSLAMYNYLSTEFTDANFTSYGAGKLDSMMVGKQHHSVNLIGTSTTQMAYAINAWVVLMAITLIGWGYALSVLMSTIAHEFKVVVHVPFAMFGSLTAGAKFITSILVILVQALVTIFLYYIVMDLLMALNTGATSQFGDMHSSGAVITIGNKCASFIQALASNNFVNSPAASSFDAVSHGMGTLIYLVVSTLITAVFAYIALKGRPQIVKALSETIGSFIDKLFLTGASNPLSNAQVQQGGGASEANELSSPGDLMNRVQSAASTGMQFANYNRMGNMLNSNHNNGKNSVRGGKGGKNLNSIMGGTKGKNAGGSRKKESANGMHGADKQNFKGINPNSENNGKAKDLSASQSGGNDSVPTNALDPRLTGQMPTDSNQQPEDLAEMGQQVGDPDASNVSDLSSQNQPTDAGAKDKDLKAQNGDQADPNAINAKDGKDSKTDQNAQNDANNPANASDAQTDSPNDLADLASQDQNGKDINADNDDHQDAKDDIAASQDQNQQDQTQDQDQDQDTDNDPVANSDNDPASDDLASDDNTDASDVHQLSPDTDSDLPSDNSINDAANGDDQAPTGSDDQTFNGGQADQNAPQDAQQDAGGLNSSNETPNIASDQINGNGNSTNTVNNQNSNNQAQTQNMHSQNSATPYNRRSAAISNVSKASQKAINTVKKAALNKGLHSSNATVQAAAAKRLADVNGQSPLAQLPTHNKRQVAVGHKMSASEISNVAQQRHNMSRQGRQQILHSVNQGSKAALHFAKGGLNMAKGVAGMGAKSVIKAAALSSGVNPQQVHQMFNKYDANGNKMPNSFDQARKDFKQGLTQTRSSISSMQQGASNVWNGRGGYTQSIARDNARAMKHEAKVEQKLGLDLSSQTQAGRIINGSKGSMNTNTLTKDILSSQDA